VHFQEGYVEPHQLVVFGRRVYAVKSLLANLGIFAEYSDDTGLAVKLDQAV
jgi:hypothetical protein